MSEVTNPISRKSAIAMPQEITGASGTKYLLEWRIGGGGHNYRAMCANGEEYIAKFPFLREVPYPEVYHREVYALERIKDHNVISLSDKNRPGEQPFIVLPFLRGADLDSLLISRGEFPDAVVAGLAVGICRGLEATHAQGIVHRDVKPENTFLEKSGNVRLLDYGMCYAEELLEYEDPFSSVGSIPYVSPEEIERKDLGPYTDVYSTGIMLFELLTGMQPHEGATQDDILQKHLEVDIPNPRAYRDVHAGLADIVVKATRRAPKDRFPTATCMRLALEEAFVGCELAVHRKLMP